VVVRFGKLRPVVRWEAAKREDGSAGTFSTDAATCALFDEKMLDRIEAVRKKSPERFDVGGATAVLPSATNSKLSVLISPTGYGDGTYAAHWGVDAEDEAVALVVDFKVLDWGKASSSKGGAKAIKTVSKTKTGKASKAAVTASSRKPGRAQRLELVDGTSRKFWEVGVEKVSMTVRWGRLDTEGQTQTKSFASADEALQAADRLVAEKVKKGYRKL